MTAHAKLSPSGAHRWMVCPGSVRLTKGLESPDSEHSLEGVFCHDIAARCLLSGDDAARMVGAVSDDGRVFTAEQAKHVQVYLDAVRLAVDLFGGTLLVERQVWFSDDVWGTADALLLDECGCLHVFDLKFGRGILVDARDNPQLAIYATAALFGIAAERKVHTVALHIVQPRRPDADDCTHRTWTVPVDTLIAFRSTLLEAVRATKDVDAPLVPSDHGCHFCPAASKCPALHSAALTAAQEVFSDVDTLERAAPPAPSELPAERVVQILAAIPAVESWIGAVQADALRRAQIGALPGYKAVAKLSNRRWRDEADAERWLRENHVADPFTHKLISPAAAEKLLGKKTGVDLLVERVVTGAVLAKDSDPRPPVNPADVFTDLTDE